MSLPAVPERGDLFPAGWATRVLAPALPTVDDLRLLGGFRREVDARKAYQQAHGVVSVEAARALALIDLRMGELLPDAEPGAHLPSGAPEGALSKDERHELRLLVRHADVVVPRVHAATQPEDLSRRALLNLARQHRRETTTADADAPVVVAEGRWELRRSDFRTTLADLAPGSVDLVLTDPPYPAEDLPLWSDLGAMAAKLLGPRGLLVAYSGQLFLPEVVDRLREHLTYGWTYCLELRAGARSRIMGRHIIQTWKPVVAFSTGTWPSGAWHDDLLLSPEPDKSEYAWQQHAEPARRLIERLCPPDGLVLDPFAGAGTFGVAAVSSGRRFLGVELDNGRADLCAERLRGAA